MRNTRSVSVDELYGVFKRLDGRGYKRYRELYGMDILFNGFIGRFTRIQPDPYAPPSIFEVRVSRSVHGLDPKLYRGRNIVPVCDFIYRLLYHGLSRYSSKCGSGYSCYLGVPRPSPVILLRSAVEFEHDDLILRFYVGLPARGRLILGDRAYSVLVEKIPKTLSFIYRLKDKYREELLDHIELYRDYVFLKNWLYRSGYVAFIADNSILPRESSVSDRPLPNAKPFKSPLNLRREIRLPSGRVLSGMVLPRGLTIVTGGGYHGKTTLLNSLAEAIYPHIRGDGREYVVVIDKTMYVEAENGRIINCVDISAFIDNLPNNIDTKCFSSLNASGSTSMAASINEAIEAGVELLLIDEDTSATNLLYKDRFIKEVIREEPITTLVELVKSMIRETNTSFIIVSSASSAFLSLADTIILMQNYAPRHLEKHEIPETSLYEGLEKRYNNPRKRVFKGIKDYVEIKARGYRLTIKYRDTKYELRLDRNPRIVEKGQVKMIAYIIDYIVRKKITGTVEELIDYINKLFREKGFKAYTKTIIPPDLTWIDGLDVIWVLNRLYNTVFLQ
ncbi:MAG: ATP-binding protein [Desulfurococcales archaeon ex4484_58]|nr:MAG: ATP-binding protein [Desulfurococcales archaeon ex4484_58]